MIAEAMFLATARLRVGEDTGLQRLSELERDTHDVRQGIHGSYHVSIVWLSTAIPALAQEPANDVSLAPPPGVIGSPRRFT